MKTIWTGLLACLLAPALGAAVLQDWSSLRPGENVGTWADSVGSTLTVNQAQGPGGGKALRVDSKLVHWGGVWAAVQGSLTQDGSLRFQAKADKALQVRVSLTDASKLAVIHVVRIQGGGWESFELPLASFTKSEWQDSAAPATGTFDPQRLASVNLSPVDAGASEVEFGALESIPSPGALKDGEMGPGLVQDFVALGASAFGPFADTKGSAIAMALTASAPKTTAPAALFEYTLVDGGWCGEWIRAGGDWKGQDWRGAKGLVVEVYSETPLQFQLSFNDANQNAYVSGGMAADPGAWRTVDFPLSSFGLNPYYQPAQAKKGAPLDLSNVETFNLSPMTIGTQRFWVRVVRLEE